MGVYMGGSGLVLKPVSGLLEFFSKSIGGTGEAISAFGEEVTRVPKTRIRSPRQFMATGLPTGTLSHTLKSPSKTSHCCLIKQEEPYWSSRGLHVNPLNVSFQATRLLQHHNACKDGQEAV